MARRLSVLFALLAAVTFLRLSAAQDAAPDAEGTAQPAAPSAEQPPEVLSQTQLQLVRDFERFEKSLYDVAEFSRRTDPERAELLYRARSQSQEWQILLEMQALAESLKPQPGGKLVIADAPERQEQVLARLQELLKVLQSADERDRLQRDFERIQDLWKDTNRLIGKQRDVLAETKRRPDPSSLEDRERDVAKDADRLADKIDQQDKARTPESPSPSSENQTGQEKPASEKPEGDSPESLDSKNGQKPGEQKPGEQKPGAEKPSGDESQKPGEPKAGDQESPKPEDQGDTPEEKNADQPEQKGQPDSQGDAAKPQSRPQSPPQPGEPMPPSGESPPSEEESQPSPSPMDGSPQQPQELGAPSQPQPQSQPAPSPPSPSDRQKPERTPGRDELEQARDQMKNAIEELKKKDKEAAVDSQQQALTRLEQMKARLEEILRQLREQEKELMLATLEARLQKIRKSQMQINAETRRLDKTPVAEREDRHQDRSVALSRDERDVVVETEKALELLRSEGSSVAFPEALQQMRDNMVTVSERLNRADTGETTQVIEDLIVETLDEMILAISQEMQRQKEKQQQNQQQQQQQQGDQQDDLVQEIAELKMIRSLQNQVNRLTRQIGRELDGEQALDPDHLKLTEDLARRQERLQKATYDLSVGKNK